MNFKNYKHVKIKDFCFVFLWAMHQESIVILFYCGDHRNFRKGYMIACGSSPLIVNYSGVIVSYDLLVTHCFLDCLPSSSWIH